MALLKDASKGVQKGDEMTASRVLLSVCMSALQRER